MGQLIDDLLKLSNLSRLEIRSEYTDLSEIAESIAAELKAANPERKAEIIINRNITATGDKSLIQIALQNLLDNAWKYTKKKPVARIEFGSQKSNGQTIFFVKDNGVGFEMKHADKLFKSFHRLHSSTEFEGTGVGLAIVERIIHRHHGSIWAESEVDQGTTFYFTI